jgi:hypothetical protein
MESPAGDSSNEVCATVQWRGVTLELPVAMGNDYISIARRCYGTQ